MRICLPGMRWNRKRQCLAAERNPAEGDRFARLEEEVAELRREIGGVKDQLERFRKQFE
jgi:hypothetical protein